MAMFSAVSREQAGTIAEALERKYPMYPTTWNGIYVVTELPDTTVMDVVKEIGIRVSDLTFVLEDIDNNI